MSGVVRHIKVVNRLAKLITMPGGKKVGDAIADAEAALGEIEGDCVAAIDERLAELAAVAAAEGPAGGARLYALSNEIIPLAWMLKLRDLGQAAYSLCELIDLSSDREGGCDPRALTVHLESLKLLRHADRLGQAGGEIVLDGLAKLVAHAKSLHGSAAKAAG
jgi:hypothetical protein